MRRWKYRGIASSHVVMVGLGWSGHGFLGWPRDQAAGGILYWSSSWKGQLLKSRKRGGGVGEKKRQPVVKPPQPRAGRRGAWRLAAFEHRDEMELQNSDSPVRGVMLSAMN